MLFGGFIENVYLCTAKIVERATFFSVRINKQARNGYSERPICKRVIEQTVEHGQSPLTMKSSPT